MPVDLTKSVVNPYRNAQYRKSPWQNFVTSLGFRTQADAWRENMDIQAAEFDSALQQKALDMEYNDPAHQLERMRAAGLNPDIDGGSSISPGEAPALPQDPSTPMQSTGWDGTIGSLANGILSSFSTALGLVSSVQGISRNLLENRLLSFQSDKDIADYAFEMAPKFLSAPGENSDMDVSDYLDDAFNRAQLFAGKNLPKKFRNKFNSSVKAFFDSAPAETAAYRQWYDLQNSSKDYYQGKHTFYSPSPEIMDMIYKHLGSAYEQITQLELKSKGQELSADIAENEVREGINQNIDVLTAAGSENAKNETDIIDNQIRKIFRGSVQGLLKDLDSSDEPFAKFFKVALSIFMFSQRF